MTNANLIIFNILQCHAWPFFMLGDFFFFFWLYVNLVFRLEKHCLRNALSFRICCVILYTGLYLHRARQRNRTNCLYFEDYIVSWVVSDCSSLCLPSYGWWRGIIDFLLWFSGASVCKWTHPKPVNSSKFHKVMKQDCALPSLINYNISTHSTLMHAVV